MKAILEFNLNDSDDQMAHNRCIKSLDMAMALWTIVHNTKKGLEHQMAGLEFGEKKELNMYEVLDLVYDEIYKILEEHNIDTDKLIN